VLRELFHDPWFALWVLHGHGTLMAALLFIIYCWGTHWAPGMAIPAAIAMVLTVHHGIVPSRYVMRDVDKQWSYHLSIAAWCMLHLWLIIRSSSSPSSRVPLGSVVKDLVAYICWVRSAFSCVCCVMFISSLPRLAAW
jgi:hypothetical protein